MNRFTETLKWSDPWFRRLSPTAKLAWFYAVDHCDNIGVVELDLEFLSADCGSKCNEKTIQELGERLQPIGGNRYFIPKFIGFQYGRLSESCRPHEKVIEAIRSHGLVLTPLGYRYPVDRVCIGYPEKSDGVSYTPQDSTGIRQEEEQDRKKGKASCDEIMEFCKSNGLFPRDAEYLWNRWESNGWQNANKPIKNWKAVIRSWKAQGYLPSQKAQNAADFWPEPASEPEPEIDLMARLMANKARSAAKQREEEGTPPDDIEVSDDGGVF